MKTITTIFKGKNGVGFHTCGLEPGDFADAAVAMMATAVFIEMDEGHIEPKDGRVAAEEIGARLARRVGDMVERTVVA